MLGHASTEATVFDIRGAAALALFAVLSLGPATPARAAGDDLSPEQLARLLEYDDRAPIDVDVTRSERDESGVTIQDLTYASPRVGRVPAMLLFPQKPGKYPAAVFLHSVGGARTSFLPEALALARTGWVALLVEAPFARPTELRRSFDYANPEVDRDIYAQTVVDVRRGLDLLLARGNVDPARIAFVGQGFGAQVGGILVGVDRRVAAAVLVAGAGSFTKLVETSFEAEIVAMKAEHAKRRLDDYVQVMAPLDAANYVGRAQIPLLFQYGQYDTAVPEQMVRAYADAAKGPKDVRGYVCGHEMNDPAAARDRAEWLFAQFGARGR
jgi:cephalosporin-C deacetylase-like acetyl esterase